MIAISLLEHFVLIAEQQAINFLFRETVEFDHTAKRDISKSSDSVKPLIFNFDAILDLQTIIENAVKEVDK